MIDKYFTSPQLADELLAHFSGSSPKAVADFAVGDGALLKAALKIWPNVTVIGNDIDASIVNEMDNSLSALRFHSVDFLSDAARQETFCTAPDLLDLVVLNPPFSYRGSAREHVNIGGVQISCSKAMAFIAESTRYLAPNGQLLAIVPESGLTGERDQAIRDALSQKFFVEDLGRPTSKSFSGISVSVRLLRLRRLDIIDATSSVSQSNKFAFQHEKAFDISIMRGSKPYSKSLLSPDGIQFIHSTHLQNHTIRNVERIHSSGRQLDGAAVLLPRVGRPCAGKVALKEPCTAILSDCVFALKTIPGGFEQKLWEDLILHWKELAALYSGTCASYVTVKKLQAFLENLGYVCEIVGNMSDASVNRALAEQIERGLPSEIPIGMTP